MTTIHRFPERVRRLRERLEAILRLSINDATLAQIEVYLREYDRSLLAERVGECICDTSPGTDGPDEVCPQHGRRYSELVEMFTRDYTTLTERLGFLEAEVRRAQGREASARHQADHYREQNRRLEQVSRIKDAHIETLTQTLNDLEDVGKAYDGKSIAEIVHDFTVVRGDLSEGYARVQMVEALERHMAQRLSEIEKTTEGDTDD